MYNKCFVFRRKTGGSSTTSITNGHVGWAFQLADGTFLCGATENPSGGDGGIGVMKGVWTEICNEEVDVLHAFRQMRDFVDSAGNNLGRSGFYDDYKILISENPDPSAADTEVIWCSQQPFQGAGYLPFERGRNCLDDTYDILTAYGKEGLNWPSNPLHFRPNDWFDSLWETSNPIPF